MGIELATAYVNIVPSTRDLASGLKKDLVGPLGAAGKVSGETAAKGFAGMSTQIKKIGSALAVVGIAAFLKSSVTKALEAEKSWANLKVAVNNTGTSFDSAEASIKKTLAAQSALSAFSGGQLRTGFTALVQTTGSVTRAQELLGITTDLARAKNIDMATASKIVGKVAMGNVSALTRYGIVLDKGATATEALAALQKKFGGAAEAYGNTTQGSIDKANNSIAKLQTSIGSTLLPTIGRFAGGVSKLLDSFDKMEPAAKDATVAVAGVGAAALIATPYIASLDKAFKSLGVSAGGLYLLGSAAIIIASIGSNTGINRLSVETGKTAQAFGIAAKYGETFAQVLANIVMNILPGLGGIRLFGQTIERAGKALGFFKPDNITAVSTAAHQGRAPLQGLTTDTLGLESAQEGAESAVAALARAMDGTKAPADSLAAAERAAKDASLSLKGAILDHAGAHERLNQLRKDGKQGSDEYKRAQLEVEQTELRVKDATADSADAVQVYNDKLNAVPPAVNTKVTASTGVASSAITGFKSNLFTIPPSKGTKVTAETAAATKNVTFLKSHMSSIKDQKATITVTAAATAAKNTINGIAAKLGFSWRLAQGAIIPRTAGGVSAIVGEGGYDEAVIPLNRSPRSMMLLAQAAQAILGTVRTAAPGQGGIVINIAGSKQDADTIAIAAENAVRRVLIQAAS